MPTEAQIMQRVGEFIAATGVDTAAVVQGQTNRVPPPLPSLYVVFWESWRRRIATNTDAYDTVGDLRSVATPMQLRIQVDLHGDGSADAAQRLYALWRDPFGCDFMGAVAQPLYSDDPVQVPFWDGENQTENRWTCYLHMQANMVIELEQDFADTTALSLVEVGTLL